MCNMCIYTYVYIYICIHIYTYVYRETVPAKVFVHTKNVSTYPDTLEAPT